MNNLLHSLHPSVRRVLTWFAWPLLYVVLFIAFAYITFPYERLRQRIVAGYNAAQGAKPKPSRMQIGDASWSFRFPGVVLTDVELIGPKPETAASSAPAQKDEEGNPIPVKKAARQHTQIDEVYVGVSPFAMLFGAKSATFSGEGLGGEFSGSFRDDGRVRHIEADLEGIDPSQIPGIIETLQLPLNGALSGEVDLTIPEGKLALAEGSIHLVIDDAEVGDGVTKVRGLFALPTINAGTVSIDVTAQQGRVKLEKLEADGDDLKAFAEGKLRLRDPVDASLIEGITLNFGFSDGYRDKNDTTRSLLGKPGDKLGGVIDLNPDVKRAKKSDGKYHWRVSGPMTKPRFQPDGAGAAGAAGARPRRR